MPFIVQPFADEVEEFSAMISANFKRRIYSRQQKAEIIAEYLRMAPERVNRWIARDIGVSDHTVEDKRVELEDALQIAKHDELVGQDGKTYQRHKQTRQPKPQDSPEPINNFEPEEAEEESLKEPETILQEPQEERTPEPQSEPQRSDPQELQRARHKLNEWVMLFGDMPEFKSLVEAAPYRGRLLCGFPLRAAQVSTLHGLRFA